MFTTVLLVIALVASLLGIFFVMLDWAQDGKDQQN